MAAANGERRDMMEHHINALTGIRFFFAILVVLLHIDMSTDWLDAVPALHGGIVFSGGAGVNFFFILSGFILTYIQSARGFTRTKYHFFLARAARIYPVYLLGFALAATFVFTHEFNIQFKPEEPALQRLSLITQGVLLQAWFPPIALNWNAPGWSLSAEMFFYLLFPFITPFFMRQRSLTLLACIGVFYLLSVGIPILFSLFGLYELWGPDTSILNKDSLFKENLLHFFPLFRLPEFLTGICLAGLFLKNRETISRFAPFLLQFGLVCLVAGLQTGPFFFPLITINNGVFGPLACCIILGLIGASEHGITKLVGSRIFTMLGHSSYALYILHLPILFIYIAILPPGINAAMAVALYLLTVIFLSVCAYYFLERPMQRFILNNISAKKIEA